MSDALLKEISSKLSDIHAALKGGAATAGAGPTKAQTAAGAPTAPKPGAGTAPPVKTAAEKAAEVAAKKAADKVTADKATAAATAATAAKGPAAGTKAPGGKHTIEQVRDAIRKVAANESLGKASAKEILTDDGGGVERVADLKPENYDKVFEACQVLLSSEGAPATAAPAPEDDLM
jgi:hypothetical protein